MSYSETKSFLGLLIVCVISLIVMFFPTIQSSKEIDKAEAAKLDSLVAALEAPDHLLFTFDPNLLSVDSLILLGFPEKVAQRLNNYRSKGGSFQVKGDVRKIYGLSDDLFSSIHPYISLPDSLALNQNANKIFDINATSINELKSIDDIDALMASRIIRYRDLLGGFISKDQLVEVYQLGGRALLSLKKHTFIDSNFQTIKIRINHTNKEELMRHPYISRQLAEDIVRFREINGAIESEKLLASFKSVDKSNFQKLISYLEFH